MAIVREELARNYNASNVPNAFLYLIYDDATLKASAFEASVAADVPEDMTVFLSLRNGFKTTQIIPKNRFNQAIPIPAQFQPTGSAVTTRFGIQTIDWGIDSIAIAFNGVVRLSVGQNPLPVGSKI